MKTKHVISIGFLALLLLLTGCVEKNHPSEDIHKVLENVVAAEKEFEEQQEPLITIEKQEKVIYDEMMTLGKKEQAKINELADKAVKLTEKRKEHIIKEQKSLNKSKKEFSKVKKIISKTKEEKISKKAEQLNNTMMDRYAAHDLMYEEYVKSIKSDQELYSLMKRNDVTLDQLEAQVNLLNQHYEKVFALNKEFNELTEDYNEEKMAFYKASGLKIEEEK